jgi:transposase
MEEISKIGLDIAKNVFRVHGIDEAGNIVVQRQLRRRQSSRAAKLPTRS